MSVKGFSGAPFGTQTERFNSLGIHPALKLPGAQFPFFNKETSEQASQLGPGTYEDPPGPFSPLILERKASRPGWEKEDARFKETEKFCIPGPGTYGYPYQELERRAHKSAGNKGILDSGNMTCRPPETSDSGLGPGIYNLKSYIDEFVKKSAGKRGPYDIFSGARNQPYSAELSLRKDRK